jgi:hypothetical protein
VNLLSFTLHYVCKVFIAFLNVIFSYRNSCVLFNNFFIYSLTLVDHLRAINGCHCIIDSFSTAVSFRSWLVMVKREWCSKPLCFLKIQNRIIMFLFTIKQFVVFSSWILGCYECFLINSWFPITLHQKLLSRFCTKT